MRVLITGAGGFLGSGLAARLAGQPGITSLTLTDRSLPTPPSGATNLAGDLTETGFVDHLLAPGFDLVYHLASLPGARAEAEPDLGHAINLMAPMALARTLAARNPGARLVFASSIAVYGRTPDKVTPHTAPQPLLTYGAHKWMLEILLQDMSRRGELTACSLRLPGIVARPMSDSGHGSAFMSQIFHHAALDLPYACPVPADARCWFLSRTACLTLLVQAGLRGLIGTLQPPVLPLTMGAVSQTLAQHFGRPTRVTWGQDARLTTLFGSQPDLDAGPALDLGLRADADAETLIRNAVEGLPCA